MLWTRKETKPSDESTSAERRETARLDKVFPVYLEGDRGIGLGIARNISAGGLFVETRAPQPIGSQVRVTFEAEAGAMVAVAEVRYVCHLLGRAPDPERGPLAVRGMGMRFVYFEPGTEGEHEGTTIQ
jgi:hypothetical protein